MVKAEVQEKGEAREEKTVPHLDLSGDVCVVLLLLLMQHLGLKLQEFIEPCSPFSPWCKHRATATHVQSAVRLANC
jgi:hypothetical protein